VPPGDQKHVLPRITVVVCLFLAACGRDVREVRLADVNLSDMTLVQQLGRELGPEDRTAFATYVAVHGGSDRNCGHGPGARYGPKPETIGDAILFMRTTSPVRS